jgi:osmoprotectant transport system ATP-binding protein
LRQALDAALSSPSGLGVAVDDQGRPVGGVLADDVLVALNEQRPEALPKLGVPDKG